MKQHLIIILKYLIAIIIGFGLIMLWILTGPVISRLTGKEYYGPDADYSSDHELYPRLEYNVFGDALTQWAPAGAALGAGLFTILLLWKKSERAKPSNLIFLLLLVIIVALSMENYGMGDEFFDRHTQVLYDLVIFTSGILVLLKTLHFRSESAEELVQKTITIFFISSQAVLLPGIFAFLWYFNLKKGILSATAQILPAHNEIIPNFTNSYLTWISYATITGGYIISVLSLYAMKK